MAFLKENIKVKQLQTFNANLEREKKENFQRMISSSLKIANRFRNILKGLDNKYIKIPNPDKKIEKLCNFKSNSSIFKGINLQSFDFQTSMRGVFKKNINHTFSSLTGGPMSPNNNSNSFLKSKSDKIVKAGLLILKILRKKIKNKKNALSKEQSTE